MPDPRATRAYRNARATWLTTHRRNSGCCDKCGTEMDYSGKGRPHKRTATIEHTLPVETHPDLVLDTSLWQGWCLSCNAKGNRNRDVVETPAFTPSRDW